MSWWDVFELKNVAVPCRYCAKRQEPRAHARNVDRTEKIDESLFADCMSWQRGKILRFGGERMRSWLTILEQFEKQKQGNCCQNEGTKGSPLTMRACGRAVGNNFVDYYRMYAHIRLLLWRADAAKCLGRL